MFLLNSRLSRCAAPRGSSGRMSLQSHEDPFLRTYGVNLPSSLAETLPNAWGSYSPAYLCRFAVRTRCDSLEAFLAGTAYHELVLGCPATFPSPLTDNRVSDLPDTPRYRFGRLWPANRSWEPAGSPHRSNVAPWDGNINPLSIAFAVTCAAAKT